jgi:hypothetical protein
VSRSAVRVDRLDEVIRECNSWVLRVTINCVQLQSLLMPSSDTNSVGRVQIDFVYGIYGQGGETTAAEGDEAPAAPRVAASASRFDAAKNIAKSEESGAAREICRGCNRVAGVDLQVVLAKEMLSEVTAKVAANAWLASIKAMLCNTKDVDV